MSKRNTMRTSPGARRTHRKNTQQNKTMIFKIFGGVLFGVVAMYIGVVNASAVRGDEIRDLEKQIAQLTMDADILAVEEARVRSFAEPTEDSHFQKVDMAHVRVIAIANHDHSAGGDIVALAR